MKWWWSVVLAFLNTVSCWTKSSFFLQSHHRIHLHGMARLDLSTNSANDSVAVKVLGVCGGIGSGKSAACNLLVTKLNCLTHIDTDSIAHSVYEPDSKALHDIVAEFGTDVVLDSGEIDRKKLGSIVFADDNAMKRLERIVWPHVKTKIQERIAVVKSAWNSEDSKIPIIVVEAAVLLDADWNEFLDGVWFISASQKVAIARLQNKRGLSVVEAEKRILAQKGRRGIGNLQHEVDSGVVSAVIENDGTLEDLMKILAEKLPDSNAWYPKR
jgi:dephospho-CoA kinase